MTQVLPFTPPPAPGGPADDKLDRFIGVKELTECLGVSRCTLWKWQRLGKFPRAVNLGGKLKMWRKSVVEAWMAEQESSGGANV